MKQFDKHEERALQSRKTFDVNRLLTFNIHWLRQHGQHSTNFIYAAADGNILFII